MLTKSNVSSFSLIPVLFVLTLFLLLSALSISVIIAGSTVYEKISENMDNNYDRRVTFSYLTTKIRQNDSMGSIYIEEKDGVDMIAIKEADQISGDEYVTYIYYYDGYIRELYFELGSDGKTVDFDFDWGNEIIKAERFEFNFNDENDKIEMSLTDMNGKVQSTNVFLRSRR